MTTPFRVPEPSPTAQCHAAIARKEDNPFDWVKILRAAYAVDLQPIVHAEVVQAILAVARDKDGNLNQRVALDGDTYCRARFPEPPVVQDFRTQRIRETPIQFEVVPSAETATPEPKKGCKRGCDWSKDILCDTSCVSPTWPNKPCAACPCARCQNLRGFVKALAAEHWGGSRHVTCEVARRVMEEP